MSWTHLLRACICCGRLAEEESGHFCRRCWRCLVKGAALRKGTAGEFKFYSLFCWSPANQQLVGALIDGLKGGHRTALAKAVVRQWLVLWATMGRMHEAEIFFVPAPPKSLGEKDHAYRLAEGFVGSLPRAQLWPGLKRHSSVSQKTLSRDQRTRANMGLICEPPTTDGGVNGDGPQWIFIDDVFTTGSTARAAYEALGRPKSFQAWVMAYRCRLQKKGNP